MTDWDWPGSTVTRVIDGDSIVCQVTRDLGFNGTATFLQKMRLGRINTPPIKTPQGQAAYQRTVALCAGLLHVTTTGPYKFRDEWMAELVTADGTNVSDQLVTEGLAVYWNGLGPRPGG